MCELCEQFVGDARERETFRTGKAPFKTSDANCIFAMHIVYMLLYYEAVAHLEYGISRHEGK